MNPLDPDVPAETAPIDPARVPRLPDQDRPWNPMGFLLMFGGACFGLALLDEPWAPFAASPGCAAVILVGALMLRRTGLGNQAFGAAGVLMGVLALFVPYLLDRRLGVQVETGLAVAMILSGMLVTKEPARSPTVM